MHDGNRNELGSLGHDRLCGDGSGSAHSVFRLIRDHPLNNRNSEPAESGAPADHGNHNHACKAEREQSLLHVVDPTGVIISGIISA
jgi:hypothetical protein